MLDMTVNCVYIQEVNVDGVRDTRYRTNGLAVVEWRWKGISRKVIAEFCKESIQYEYCIYIQEVNVYGVRDTGYKNNELAVVE